MVISMNALLVTIHAIKMFSVLTLSVLINVLVLTGKMVMETSAMTSTNLDNCHERFGICGNNDDSFTGSCETRTSVDGVDCVDINECARGSHSCDLNAQCKNSDAGLTCKCLVGYIGDGNTCTDIDECVSDVSPCNLNAACSNKKRK